MKDTGTLVVALPELSVLVTVSVWVAPFMLCSNAWLGVKVQMVPSRVSSASNSESVGLSLRSTSTPLILKLSVWDGSADEAPVMVTPPSASALLMNVSFDMGVSTIGLAGAMVAIVRPDSVWVALLPKTSVTLTEIEIPEPCSSASCAWLRVSDQEVPVCTGRNSV